MCMQEILILEFRSKYLRFYTFWYGYKMKLKFLLKAFLFTSLYLSQPLLAADTDDTVCNFATVYKNGIKAWASSVSLKPYVKEAKLRGLSCGVSLGVSTASSNKSTGISNSRKLPKCNAHFYNCFGEYVWDSGHKYIGEWKDGKQHGIGTHIYPRGDVYIGNFKFGNRSGQSVYIWSSGQALFETNFQKDTRSNSTVRTVFPNLVRKFQSLSPSNRKSLQRSLKNKGFYESTIDGKWGRNTLIGVARFSLEYLRTVNLNDGYTIDAVNAGLQSQAYSNKVIPATQSVLNVITQKKEKASKVAANAYRLEKTFKNYGALSRKQIQWSLKKRGYYKSSIDGLWGTGTKNAVVRFAQDKGLDAFYSGEVYDEVSRGLNVPSSFAVAKKQPKPSQNSGGSSNALGIFLLLGALCSLTPDAAACISGARK